MNDMNQERLGTILTPLEGRQNTVLKFIGTSFNLTENGRNTLISFNKDKLLGQGDLSVVYLGEIDYGGEKNKVAVKLFLPLISLSQNYGKEVLRDAFENEAKILGRLDHPSIAKFYGSDVLKVGGSTEVPVIVREYFNETLLQRMSKLEGEEKVGAIHNMLQQISSAVEYINDNGIVVSDVNPKDIMVRENGEYVLADLNLQKDQEASLIGYTSEFSAPEVQKIQTDIERNKNITPESQVYSLGLLAYGLLKGNFASREEISMGLKPEKPDSISEEIFKVLEKALDVKPENRYKNVNEFSKAFEEAFRISIEEAKVTPNL